MVMLTYFEKYFNTLNEKQAVLGQEGKIKKTCGAHVRKEIAPPHRRGFLSLINYK
jgi:hypothetical protein